MYLADLNKGSQNTKYNVDYISLYNKYNLSNAKNLKPIKKSVISTVISRIIQKIINKTKKLKCSLYIYYREVI